MDLTEERKKQEFDKYNVNTIKKKENMTYFRRR